MKNLGSTQQIESSARESEKGISRIVPLAKRNKLNIIQRLFPARVPSNHATKNRSLIYAWLLSLIAVSLLLMALQSESTQFFGIVEGKQQSISFQHPVDIVQFNVVEGQQVAKGESILQVRRNDLISSLAIIDDKISEIRLANQEFIATTRAKVKALKAQQKAKYNELSTAINRLETRYKLNTKLQKNSNYSTPKKSTSDNLLVSEIKDLKASRWHTNNSYQAQIDNLNEQLNLEERPATAQLAELAKRKSELVRQQSDLHVSSIFLGSVGSILYKTGETVEPFKPIISLHSAYPNIVKGYIHESVLNTIKIGQTVWVKSLSAKVESKAYQGVVQSLGSRMVEYPLRLRRDKNVLSFGREVVIKLLDNSAFLLSEKVIVSLDKPDEMLTPVRLEKVFDAIKSFFMMTNNRLSNLELSERKLKVNQLRPIVSKIPTLRSKLFEASGITWWKESGEYLVISDENQNERTVLGVMNRAGELTRLVRILDAPEIDDIESISRDGDYIYLASSLSYSKKNKLKPKRRLFFQLIEEAGQLRVVNHIDLYNQLVNFNKLPNIEPQVKQLLEERLLIQDMEIESHYVHNNSLFIGFKSVSIKGNHVNILRVSELDQFVQGKITNIHLWRTIQLNLSKDFANNKFDWRLTDMGFRNGDLYLLTVNRSKRVKKSKQTSVLWKFSDDEQLPVNRLLFEHRAAEGLFIDHRKNELVVVFDEGGNRSSKYFRTNLLPLKGKSHSR